MSRELALYNEWLEALADQPEFLKELENIKDDQEEINDRFYKELSFGTAGLRGLIGMGTNRMNFYTVGKATQGLASYWSIIKNEPKIAIGYDSRNFSKEFARHAASIFAANGMRVFLYPQLSPTPALAFAVRELGCDCGVMVTASHNPAEYNGYKVYNKDGCQIDDDVADDVLKNIDKVDIFTGVKTMDFGKAMEEGKISYIDDAIPEKFCATVVTEALRPEIIPTAGLKGVYTPLNGTGNLYIQDVFRRIGMTDYEIVPEQEMPDGNFPTIPYPNPEFPEAMKLAVELARKNKADFVLATDPDADRVAIAVPHNGDYRILTGNEMGVLLLDYIAKTRKQIGTLPQRPVAIRSIVSSKLFDRVAKEYGVTVVDVLTGFKHVGNAIGQMEKDGDKDSFIMGYEEAIGFLIGTHVRDKDAIVASVLMVEMLSSMKLAEKTAIDVLNEIQDKHGYFSNLTQNLVFPGQEGMEQMQDIMKGLRNNPPEKIVGRKVTAYLDYKTGVHLKDGEQTKINKPSSNVLEYHLEDDCSIIIRPSGTEPKLKIYYNLVAKTKPDVDKLEAEYRVASVELAGIEE